MFSFEAENLRALHIVLAAALVGYVVFCFSHGYAVWMKRQQGVGQSRSRVTWTFCALVGIVVLGAAWVDGAWLARREGVIAAEGFHVVRARGDAVDTELVAQDTVRAGDVIAVFRGPIITEQIKAKQSEIASLTADVRRLSLGAAAADPALMQARADARAEWQTVSASLGMLAYDGGDRSADLQSLVARRDEADATLKRLETLQASGLAAAQDVDAARSRAIGAREALDLSRRGRDLAALSQRRVSSLDTAIVDDQRRAVEARRAGIEAVESRLEQARADLGALREQLEVRAPFAGRIVFRHRAPGLAQASEPVLAIATGAGFLAHIDVPAGEARHLRAGDRLSLRLKDALVATTIVGRYVSEAPSAQDPRRARLEVACDLPFEQFAQLSRKAVQVRLEWRPPLWANPMAWAGGAALLLAMLLWLRERSTQAPTSTTVTVASPVSHSPMLVAPPHRSALSGQMYQLGLNLRDQIENGGRAQTETLTAIEWLMDRHPLEASKPLAEGFREAAGDDAPLPPLRQSDSSTTRRVRRVIQVIAPEEETSQTDRLKRYAIVR